ncbi:MAG TPA: tripartite tricarboxylate transporter substrate binding protein [Burkholderiales bacterium]|nr:tripartite tricarboxylate transporter substrate binding protein [Burkholderiales bacterium]
MRSIKLWLAVALLVSAHSAAAAEYPNRPVRLVAPFVAGGTADVLARQIANEVSSQLGQTFVIDNRAGANGIIGTDTVAKAPPDGHTLLHVTASFVINQHIYRKLPYDVFRDFDPVTNVVLGTGYLFVINPSVPAASVKELIALAKKTGKVNYSSPGVGNTLHLAAELFNVRAGVNLLHVPYKGVAPAMNAVLSGEVQATFIPATIALELVKAGKLKAIGFTGASRWSGMPNLPTMKEQGVANLELTGSWHGWFAPAKTPPPVLARLHQEVRKALQVPRVRESIVAGGYEPDGSSPAAFRKFLRQEYDRYGEMVRVAKIPKE